MNTPADKREPSGPCVNTDREIWRERPGDYYADSIHVTEGGSIGINYGGSVIVMPLRNWFMLAAQGTTTAPPSSDERILDRAPINIPEEHRQIIRNAAIEECAVHLEMEYFPQSAAKVRALKNPEQRRSALVAESPSLGTEPDDAGVAPGRGPAVPESADELQVGIPAFDLPITEERIQGIVAERFDPASEDYRKARKAVWACLHIVARSLKNAAPQGPQQEVSPGVVESGTGERPKARNESGSDTAPAGAAAPRPCICADPWNCTQPVPGYRCRKGEARPEEARSTEDWTKALGDLVDSGHLIGVPGPANRSVEHLLRDDEDWVSCANSGACKEFALRVYEQGQREATGKDSLPVANSATTDTPRTEKFYDECLDNDSSAEALAHFARQLERELAEVEERHKRLMREADERYAALLQDMADLRHDMERGMANHNADLQRELAEARSHAEYEANRADGAIREMVEMDKGRALSAIGATLPLEVSLAMFTAYRGAIKEYIESFSEEQREKMWDRDSRGWKISEQEKCCARWRAMVKAAAPSSDERSSVEDYKERYMELIMAVARKFPDETRHQTALRYINNAERGRDDRACSAKGTI